SGCSVSLALLATLLVAVVGGGILMSEYLGGDSRRDGSQLAEAPGNGSPTGKTGDGGTGPELPNPAAIAAASQNIRELSSDIRKKIEDATVYIEVKDKEKNSTFTATGSGFVALEPGIVLTNAHVVDMLEPGSEEPESITVVVNSGRPNEKRLKGKVLGVDQRADLAALVVDRAVSPPPLTVKSSMGLAITQSVYVCGFPVGKQPARTVTVFQGQVASLSRDANTGALD